MPPDPELELAVVVDDVELVTELVELEGGVGALEAAACT